MVESAQNTSKKKKRKLRSGQEEKEERAPKASRVSFPDKERNGPKEDTERTETGQQFEDAPPWRNLQLILSLQSKDIDLQKKVELAFNYVTVKANGNQDDDDEGSETVSNSRVIVFLTNWVQSLLISSEKKARAERYKPELENSGTCLDHRSWGILKFCLAKSLKLHVSLSLSRDFLRVVHCILRDLLYRLNFAPDNANNSLLSDQVFELYDLVLGCISLVFSSHGGVSNDNLDLWVLTVDVMIKLIQKVLIDKLDGCKVGDFVMQLSCILLEPFSKFLRIHPTRKVGFRDFIDKLLEHLLCLLDVLHLHIHGNDTEWGRNLLNLVEEVVRQGLFHITHIDGFVGLKSGGKHMAPGCENQEDLKSGIKSYHRHLFEKLDKIIASKNMSALSGIGVLYGLFVDCLKKQKGVTEYSNCLSQRDAEIRKSLYDFFIQIMEPLLLETNAYLQAEVEVGPFLMDVRCMLKSMNKILARFIHDKVYIRTDDTSAGYSHDFLKLVYDMVMSYSPKINQLWSTTFDLDNRTNKEALKLVAKELIVTVRFLMEIEYEVMGNDLESLWLMMFSYAALSLSLTEESDKCSLAHEILQFGCQLINLYGELRQVNTAIFSLCKAMRRLVSCSTDGSCCLKLKSATSSIQCELYAKSIGVLLCSHDFSLAIHNAIKSIPEGQASGCIRQLAKDISESLQWAKTNCSFATGANGGKREQSTCNKQCFDLQAQLLGKGLSELYSLVLESVTVTTGNSNIIGISVEDLMIVVRPSMSTLVAVRPDCVDEFLSTVLGRTSNWAAECRSDLLSSYWVVLFFFRLYMSCRSLYRQVISLVSPDISRKMSGTMSDSFTAYSGKDWLERTSWIDEGYFSWIVQPSASLLTVIQAISDIYFQETIIDCSPLIYVLNAMALQRLVDLKRLIKSFEYLLQRHDHLIQKKLIGDAENVLYHKKIRKWKRQVSNFGQEAAELTDFMVRYLPLVAEDTISISEDPNYKGRSARAIHSIHTWNFSIGAINKNSLPSAFWWIICQNIDIWCTHAAKKKLKTFLSLLIQNYLPSVRSSLHGYENQDSRKSNEITVHQISLELLSNTALYEQKFVCRHMASRFCQILEKSIAPAFRGFTEVVLDSSPNWSEFLCVLGNTSIVLSGYKNSTNGCSSVGDSLNELSKDYSEDCKSFPSTSVASRACQRLLNLLCWMPKDCLSSSAFSLYGTYILNLERLVVGSLLGCHGALCSLNQYELLKLFVSCRRTLKYLLMASCKESMEASRSSLAKVLSESSFPILWLLKSSSAVSGLQYAPSEDHATHIKEMIFSLMDHTSYVFLTLSKDQSIHAVRTLKDAAQLNEEQSCSDVAHEQIVLSKIDPCLDFSKYVDEWKILVIIADTLKEQTSKLHLSRKETICEAEVEGCGVLELRRFSASISCFQGFLWGLASAFDNPDAKGCNFGAKLSNIKFEPICKINLCIKLFVDFISSFLHMLLLERDRLPQSLCESQTSPILNCNYELKKSSCAGSGGVSVVTYAKEPQSSATAVETSSFGIKDHSVKNGREKRYHSQNLVADDILNKVDLFQEGNIDKSLLQGFLRGEKSETAFFLRQLFSASSAILRLDLQMNCASFSSSLVPLFIAISEVLLLEFANKVEAPQPFSFVWLDGVVKFLEELGSHFPLTNPALSRSMYVRLIDLHLRAIGKCISLQGKGATLTSRETESGTKTLHDGTALSESAFLQKAHFLDEFKVRLRKSFKVFVKKPSELHLLSAIQALERALVGVEEGCTVVYKVVIGSSDGGQVSSIVAAAIDCLDLVLEFVTGPKRLNLVKRHMQSLVSCLFNIVLHLQGPVIFYWNVNSGLSSADPDSGSVILMCVEVLTRVFGKHALFQMDSCHVGHSLRIPGALFQNFLQLRISDSLRFSDTSAVVDRQFSVDLYAACCRLLCTVLKHHKSECERCIGLLENSVSVLLHCLEMADVNPMVRKGYFAWEIQEGKKCAGFFRRIYEEMRQQKDVYGRHCYQFLANYIWVYSGYGPLKTGIRRELDEALKPGVYALIDACSADDLQHLHTVFGEGPCRSTLAALQHDYKTNFQYEGKV